MPTLDDATAMLRAGLHDRTLLNQVVGDFQELVNHPRRSGFAVNDEAGEILGELAWDLDFCEGEQAIVREIENALEKLAALGASGEAQ